MILLASAHRSADSLLDNDDEEMKKPEPVRQVQAVRGGGQNSVTRAAYKPTYRWAGDLNNHQQPKLLIKCAGFADEQSAGHCIDDDPKVGDTV